MSKHRPIEHYAETRFGFEWGPSEVFRAISDDKFGVVYFIKSDSYVQEVRVTPSGRIKCHALKKIIKRRDGSERWKTMHDYTIRKKLLTGAKRT